jgi:hypothetical protein
MAKTIQSNIKRNTKDFSEYGLFMGGLDVTSKNIDQFDPLRTGFARIFITRMPRFMEVYLPEESKRIKHLIELGFTRFDGINDMQLETEDVTGGYTGSKFQVPSITRDETDGVTIACYEMSGSPIREYMETWMTGISDPLTGLSHYHGQINDQTMPFRASNHTMELFFVATDPTGINIEYCCMFANMMPRSVKRSHFNYESGSHPAVSIDLEFTASKYESPQINAIGAALLERFRILQNYLNFFAKYNANDINAMTPYNLQSLPTSDASGQYSWGQGQAGVS